MNTTNTSTLTSLRIFAQRLAIFAIVLGTLAAISSCVLAAIGVWPWLGLTATLGDTVVPEAGIYLQIGFAILMTFLCFFLPSAGRILSLETSHRQFKMSMDDVARAYWTAHQADREGNFVLNREFDAVRERMEVLRDHPNLGDLEPALLEVASQMSFESRELADVYSNDKVDRARTFLMQRKQELEEYQDRILKAHQTTSEMREWIKQVELDENVIEAQIQRLEKDLAEVLPQIGLRMEREAAEMKPVPTVVALKPKTKDETSSTAAE
ncbi:DNA repair protein [Nereida sp. MMG025]|uniref:DNA repair protein n=1 Tax=Nereida sp. MMG025 TaxID=2909981 RepID=UPI001F3DBCA1|nr:DNA repair protein [Nereida sp. MMG025]MCF6445341.1 DNA repair protein [Nereida sp. MMG025]